MAAVAVLLRHGGDLALVYRIAVAEAQLLDRLPVRDEAQGQGPELVRYAGHGEQLLIAYRRGAAVIADAVDRAERLMHEAVAVHDALAVHIGVARDRAAAGRRARDADERMAIGYLGAVARDAADVLRARDIAHGVAVADIGVGIPDDAADIAAGAALDAAVALAVDYRAHLGDARDAADVILLRRNRAAVDTAAGDALDHIGLGEDARDAQAAGDVALHVGFELDGHSARDAADVKVAADLAVVDAAGQLALDALVVIRLGHVVIDVVLDIAAEGVCQQLHDDVELVVDAHEVQRQGVGGRIHGDVQVAHAARDAGQAVEQLVGIVIILAAEVRELHLVERGEVLVQLVKPAGGAGKVIGGGVEVVARHAALVVCVLKAALVGDAVAVGVIYRGEVVIVEDGEHLARRLGELGGVHDEVGDNLYQRLLELGGRAAGVKVIVVAVLVLYLVGIIRAELVEVDLAVALLIEIRRGDIRQILQLHVDALQCLGHLVEIRVQLAESGAVHLEVIHGVVHVLHAEGEVDRRLVQV